VDVANGLLHEGAQTFHETSDVIISEVMSLRGGIHPIFPIAALATKATQIPPTSDSNILDTIMQVGHALLT